MCGIFGIHDHEEASNIVYLGLHALQHRGQESAGIVSSNSGKFYSHKIMGHVRKGFLKEHMEKLQGDFAIGHVRYTTAGSSTYNNVQPLVAQCNNHKISIAHNGNLVNAKELKEKLSNDGAIFSTSSDTEVILHLISRSKQNNLKDKIIETLQQIKGAYSLVILHNKELIAIRDPHGFRPLVLGRLEKSLLISSETCAFDLVGAKKIRDISPGEMLIINKNQEKESILFVSNQPKKMCSFEHVYFARPDSVLDGLLTYESRLAMGKQLSIESNMQADMVIPVPDSGNVAAIGFSNHSGIPFQMGLIRNHYVGRTFIEPNDSIRNFGVKLKLNAVPHLLKGKKIIMIDDSIVRGTTCKKIIRLLKNAGAKEVHVRISSPPVKHPCYYGIDTPNRKELVAHSNSIEKIKNDIGADSLAFLSIEGLKKSLKHDKKNGYCDACFTGDYIISARQDDDTKKHLKII